LYVEDKSLEYYQISENPNSTIMVLDSFQEWGVLNKIFRYTRENIFSPLSFCNFFEKSNKSKILFELAKIGTPMATEWTYYKINLVSVGCRRT
jgi:hypothetical protein